MFVQFTFDRMYCLPLAALSCITPITSNCTVLSVPATPRLKKFYCQVNTVNYYSLFIYLCFFIVYSALIFNDINSTDEGSQALQEFLQSRNPRQQHSSTLESYLIKPIQRILKYPLLLQQLRNLTDSNSSEHQHLVGTFLT